MTLPSGRIAFQGIAGAYSHLACRNFRPQFAPLPCPSFEECFIAVESSAAACALIPVENSIAGRVSEIHQLLGHAGLFIVGEHFQKVRHHLLSPPGGALGAVRSVSSHIHALSQCRRFLRRLRLESVVVADTAAAARDVAQRGKPDHAAIASNLAAELYGLDILASDIGDHEVNVTRFLLLAAKPVDPDPGRAPVLTSLHFHTRNVPAALYHALGGFADNGVNLTRLEGIVRDASFRQAAFYLDIEGHARRPSVAEALAALKARSEDMRLLGTYYADPLRGGSRERT